MTTDIDEAIDWRGGPVSCEGLTEDPDPLVREAACRQSSGEWPDADATEIAG